MSDNTKLFIIINILIVLGLIELCLTSILWYYTSRSVDKMLLVNKISDNPKEHFDGALKLLIALIAISIAAAIARFISIVMVMWNDFVKLCQPVCVVNLGFGVLYFGLLFAVMGVSANHRKVNSSQSDSYYLMPMILIAGVACLYISRFLCHFALCSNKIYDGRIKYSYIGHWKELMPQRSKSDSEAEAKSQRKAKRSTRSQLEAKSAKSESERPVPKHSPRQRKQKAKREKHKSKSDDSEEKPVRKEVAQTKKSSRESKHKRKRASDVAKLEREKSKSESVQSEQSVPKKNARVVTSSRKRKEKTKRVSDLDMERENGESEPIDAKSTNENSEQLLMRV